MKKKSPLDRAAQAVGGFSKLAVLLGVTPQAVCNWQSRERSSVPADKCPEIERLTGVRCEELRPDISWGVLRYRAPTISTEEENS